MKAKVKKILATQLGIEPDDINDDDSFALDLHMDPIAITDFVHNLNKEGFETDNLDFKEIETFEDLLEKIDHEEPKND